MQARNIHFPNMKKSKQDTNLFAQENQKMYNNACEVPYIESLLPSSLSEEI